MSTRPTPVTLVGATGLTGSSALRALLSSPVPSAIRALTRRRLDRPVPEGQGSPQTVYENTVHPDLLQLAEAITGDAGPAGGAVAVGAPGGVFVSCLGITRAKAGGLAAQERVDVDLGVGLARRAKEEGSTRCIVVSSAAANIDSHFTYSRMKGKLEKSLTEIGFDSLVILRSEVLLGHRDGGGHGFGEAIAQRLFRFLLGWGVPVGAFCIDADDVGYCIAHFVARPPKEKVLILPNRDIISIAKAWREDAGKR